MGQVIDLARRRDAVQRKTRRREPLRAQLFFDLACPFTYLATERVERAFSRVTWTATSSETLQRRRLADDADGAELVRAAYARGRADTPDVWPASGISYNSAVGPASSR